MPFLSELLTRMPLLVLTGLFLLVAAAYSSVGFGGGSTYNALLMLSGTDFRLALGTRQYALAHRWNRF